MGSVRRRVSRIAGGFQCVLGATASIFAYIVYASTPIQEKLSISQGEVTLFMFILLVFGVFSVLSGIVLLHEKS